MCVHAVHSACAVAALLLWSQARLAQRRPRTSASATVCVHTITPCFARFQTGKIARVSFCCAILPKLPFCRWYCVANNCVPLSHWMCAEVACFYAWAAQRVTNTVSISRSQRRFFFFFFVFPASVVGPRDAKWLSCHPLALPTDRRRITLQHRSLTREIPMESFHQPFDCKPLIRPRYRVLLCKRASRGCVGRTTLCKGRV